MSNPANYINDKNFYLIVSASKGYENYNEFRYILKKILPKDYTTTILSGGTKEIISSAERFAGEHHLKIKIFPTDWERFSKMAEPIRNAKMHDCIKDKPHRGCICFWDGYEEDVAHNFSLAKDNVTALKVYNYKEKTFFNPESKFSYKEVCNNLFSVRGNACFVNCISADFEAKEGVAVEFNNRFHVNKSLIDNHGDWLSRWDNFKESRGDCLRIGNIFNLITKRNYFDRPTMTTIKSALISLKNMALRTNVTDLAMPRIGCGTDGLNWDKVSSLIKEIFKDTDIRITIYET